MNIIKLSFGLMFYLIGVYNNGANKKVIYKNINKNLN